MLEYFKAEEFRGQTFDLRILGLSGSGMAKDEAFQPQEVSHLMLLYL